MDFELFPRVHRYLNFILAQEIFAKQSVLNILFIKIKF